MDKRTTILIVGDDGTPRDMLRELIEREGYQPFTAATCEQALELARGHTPDVALIDLWLADLPGHVVLHGIRQASPRTECIALLSSPAQQAGAYEALAMGAFTFLRRAYDPRQLLGLIRRAIEKRELARAIEDVKERVAVLFDSIPAGVLIVDERTRAVVDANPAAIRFIGAPKAEIIGSLLHSRELTGAAGAAPAPAPAERDGKPAATRQTGRRIPATRTVATLMIGERRHLVECFVDVSGKLAAEDRLAETLAVNRLLAESIRDVVFTVDTDGRVRRASPPEAAAEPPAADAAALLPGACRERFRGELETVLRSGATAAFSAGTPPFEQWAIRIEPIVSRAATIGAAVRIRDLAALDRTTARAGLRDLALDRARDALLVVNTEGTIVDANAAACALLGYLAAELVGMPLRQIDQPDPPVPWSRLWSQVALVEQLQVESRSLTRDGRLLNVRLLLHHAVVEGTAAMLVFIEDSAPRKERSHAAQDRDTRERSLLNAATAAAWLIDRHGLIVNLNDLAAQRSGKLPAALVGAAYDQALPSALARNRLSRAETVFIRGTPVAFEDLDGDRLMGVQITPVRDHSGAIVLADVRAQDLTAAREREALLTALWETGPAARLTLDVSGLRDDPGDTPEVLLAVTLVDANPLAAPLLGIAAAELLPAQWTAAFTPPGARRLVQALRRCTQADAATENFEMELAPGPGRAAFVSVHLAALPAVAGRVPRVVLNLVDRSARRAAQAEVIETSALERRRIRQELETAVIQPLARLAADGATVPAAEVARLGDHARRVIGGLAWDDEQELSLMAALNRLADESSARWGVTCRCNLRAAGVVRNRVLGGHLFALTREALDDAARRRGARQITITLSAAGPEGTLVIRDDGASPAPSPEEDAAQRLMRIHAEMALATLTLQPAPRGGHILTCTFANG